MKYLIVIVAVVLASGCAVLAPAEDRVVSAVERYCATTTEAERAVLRARINEKMVHGVEVTCN